MHVGAIYAEVSPLSYSIEVNNIFIVVIVGAVETVERALFSPFHPENFSLSGCGRRVDRL